MLAEFYRMFMQLLLKRSPGEFRKLLPDLKVRTPDVLCNVAAANKHRMNMLFSRLIARYGKKNAWFPI